MDLSESYHWAECFVKVLWLKAKASKHKFLENRSKKVLLFDILSLSKTLYREQVPGIKPTTCRSSHLNSDTFNWHELRTWVHPHRQIFVKEPAFELNKPQVFLDFPFRPDKEEIEDKVFFSSEKEKIIRNSRNRTQLFRAGIRTQSPQVYLDFPFCADREEIGAKYFLIERRTTDKVVNRLDHIHSTHNRHQWDFIFEAERAAQICTTY